MSTPLGSAMASVTSAALVEATVREVFEREGWVHWPQLVNEPTLTALLGATEALERTAAAFELNTLLRGVYFEMQSASGRKGEPAVFPGALRKITAPSKGEPAFAKLRKDARVLAAAGWCGITHPHCLIDQVNFKLPYVGTSFPYHQDEAFLFGEALDRVRTYGGVNVVIALDAADATNGGFQVLGRTHQNGVVEMSYDVSRMNNGGFDESHLALPTLEPGDAVLFHPRLAHGSAENRSGRSRRLVTLWLAGAAPSG